MRNLALFVVSIALLVSACVAGDGNIVAVEFENSVTTMPPTSSPTTLDTTTTAPTTTTLPPRPAGVITPETVFQPWGSVNGLTMFRGNPTRTFYGSGPIGDTPPTQQWRFPSETDKGYTSYGMVGYSGDVPWGGMGWTGQPLVYEREDGLTEVIFGAFDKKLHFLNAATGERLRPDFDMGDIIKGTPTLDPDGYPLLYSGSTDPRFRIMALDGDEVREVWSLDAHSVDGMWNDDWDSNPVIIDDIMYEGGENSYWFAIKLNRGYDADGKVTVDPKIVFSMPSWTDELRDVFGRQHSVESSIAVFGQKAYFTTSAGRVVGLDVSDIENGNAEVFFDFWMGDDTDATPVIDKDGFLYVVSHFDDESKSDAAKNRIHDRVTQVSNLVKLDTSIPADSLTSVAPIVWSVDLPAGSSYGAWATPALHEDGVLFVIGESGDLLAVDTDTGTYDVVDNIGRHAWSSPLIVDNTLLVITNCRLHQEDQPRNLRAYNLDNPRAPVQMWEATITTGNCVQATAAAWNGQIFVGSRDGFLYALGW